MTDNIILTVVLSLIALGVVFTLQAIYRPRGLWVAIFLIFVTLTTPIALYKPFVDSLGFPIASENSVAEDFIAYNVSNDQEWIFLWVIDTESGEPRAYKIPYSKEAEKALSDAEAKQGEGVDQYVTILPPVEDGVTDNMIEIEDADPVSGSGGLKHHEVPRS